MLCFLQITFILFTLISQITSIPFTFTVTNFTITPQDPLPLHNTSYNFSYTLLEYMPGGVITQLILPSPYNIPGYEKKVFDYSGYPEDMMFESFVQGPNLILDIKNNYEVPAGSRMNLKVGPFKNPDHNRYYNQTLTMTFEEGPQNLHYTTTFDPHFRLKNFGTSPPLMAILESYVLGNTSRHWISVNTSVIVFSASKFVFDFATQIDISGSACQLNPMSFIGALCTATSPSQITVYFPQERSPGVYNFSLSNVINPNITNVSSPYTMTFTSFDWEGLVMEKSVLNYPYQCSEGCQVCNATQCLHCFPSSYLDMGICVTTCPFGSYPDDELKICRRDCVDGCLECTGTKTNCSKCVPQLSLFNFSCISECPNPYTSVESVCMNISKPSSTLSVPQEMSSSKGNMRLDVVLGTIPVFSIYIGICFLIWVWSGISCKASMNVTSLMVLLSSMEPCLYIYLLVTAISFGISLLSALFVFLVTAKVTLQAFYVTTSLQNLTFFELDSDSKRSSLLKILEYSYNLKLGFLRDTQLFGRKSLRLSRNARKNMNKALLSPLKASMAIEILVVLGYIGYYITITIQHETVRLLHIESAAFLALQVLVGVFQTVRMKRSTNRYVVNMRESATTRSSSVNNRAQGLNESSMQKLNQEESSGKIELDKSGDLSLQDIVIMRKEDKSSRVETKESNHNKELAKEIDKDNNAENCLGPDKMDTGHKDWEGEGSVIIEVNDGPEQKKESVETFGQRSGSKKKSPFSLKRRLQMMSDKVVKTLANFSSTKKKRQAIEINDIKAFVKTKSSEPDAVDKKTIERTMSLANDRGRQYLVENDEDGVVPGQTQEKWWSLGKEMSFGNLVKQPNSAEKPDSQVNRELYDGKVVFTKGSQPGKFLFNNGKFILHRFVKKKAENRSQNVEEVVLEK